MKTIQYWCTKRPTAQWNRTECLEINPSTRGNLVYDYGGISNHWNKGILPFFNGAGTTI